MTPIQSTLFPLEPTLKRCSKCQQMLGLDHFRFRSDRPNARRTKCIACHRAYDRGYETQGTVRQRRKERRAWYRAYVRQPVEDYRQAHPCLLCGETETCCLDFHHSGEKTKSINRMLSERFSLDQINAEIAKCVVLCSNCHRKLHAGLVTLPN